VPGVGNIHAGDMEEIMAGERVGVVLRDFFAAAADRLLLLLDEPETRAALHRDSTRVFLA